MSHHEDISVRPKKSLGQHWLHDKAAVKKVLDTAELSPEDTVVEVGAGPGILTPGLCERAGQVIAVELDQELIPQLEALASDHPNLEIRQADILAVDPAELPQPYNVVGNVPYYITSKIIRHFLETSARPDSMTLTIQAEVAERICAEPPKMSVLAVSVQLYGKPRIAGRIKAESFSPPPEVDSAVLRIENIGKNLAKTLGDVSTKDFFRVVKAGFAAKRKQLHNTLAGNLGITGEEATESLKQIGIDPTRRAETLTIPEWVALAKQTKQIIQP